MRCAFGVASLRPGSTASQPRRVQKAVKTRADAACAGHRFAHPGRVVDQGPDVGGVRTHGVFGQPALEAQMPDEGVEGIDRIPHLDDFAHDHLCTLAAS